MPNFPESDKLNISAFSGILENTTTANKFLWTLSILDILQHRYLNGDSSNKILFADISRSMAEIAIPPLYKFRLRFGRGEGKGADHTKRYLDNIFGDVAFKDDMPIFNATDIPVQQKFNKECRPLLERYVSYRWLAPFFQKELKREKKEELIIKSTIENLASDRFSGKSPVPYRIVGQGENAFIEFNDAWKKYIVSNMAFIHGWAMWKWVNFLQDRNPGIPGIVNKLEESSSRSSAKEQRNFWNAILRHKKKKRCKKLRCIYSRGTISAGDRYDLDHYVPWSYIGHCHVWNLIPVARKANRAKGNQLPDTDTYLRSFVKAQHDALWVYHRHFSSDLKTKWEYMIDVYSEHLSLSDRKLRNFKSLHKAYRRVIKFNISAAKKSGFTPNWKLKKK